MQLLYDMKKGLEILEPFLKEYDFEFDIFENFRASSGRFTLAKYKNESKEFILGYDYSIGQVVYQFENLAVSHDFYLDHLGYDKQKEFKDIPMKDKLLPFKYLRNDFEFLIEDFFKGKCIRLKEISSLQDNIITEYDRNARRVFNIPYDKLRIEKARQDFRKKDFLKCKASYEKVVNKEFMNELDVKLIEYCESQIKG